jgi:predicted lipoprotein with Yx(FWY)xxD motif
MKRLLILGAALATSIGLAACGAGAGGDSAAPASPPSDSTATVSSADLGSAGQVLVDSSGKALYASDEEAGGTVLCTGACLSFWTPLTVSGAPSGASLPGTLGVAERPDGTRQVTYDGKLLYTFTEDQPGEVTADGFADAFDGKQFTWHVVHTDTAKDSTGTSGSSGGLYG